ncbi:MAG: glycosyltransferase family 4 protein, partial [Bacteroidales bacterium]|nr:glycosyltransferase family 4 protein [Bacteroidales bacterium]
NIDENKIIFIPNAADFSISDNLLNSNFDIQEFRNQHNFNDKFVITYVGAHGVANHLIQIIDAAEKLTDTNVLFLLIGDGMKKEELKNTVYNKKLKNVKFINSVPKQEVFKYILASDIGTSVLKKVDTFKTIYSNKTFDYMACKKPVLLLIDGVSRDLIEKANCGIYAEPENIEDIEQKIRYLLSLNEEALIKLGNNGYNYAKNNFDRKILANEYINFINKNLNTNVL